MLERQARPAQYHGARRAEVIRLRVRKPRPQNKADRYAICNCCWYGSWLHADQNAERHAAGNVAEDERAAGMWTVVVRERKPFSAKNRPPILLPADLLATALLHALLLPASSWHETGVGACREMLLATAPNTVAPDMTRRQPCGILRAHPGTFPLV